MATDYDALRTRMDTDPSPDGEVRLDNRRSQAAAATLTVDDDALPGYGSSADPLELLAGEDLTVTVVTQRRDEFTCARCFLIHHRSRYSRAGADGPLCCDCT